MPASRLSPREFGAAYGIALVVMVLLDAIWLGWLAIGFYKHEIGPLMLDAPKWLPAALFYLLYPVGLIFLALNNPPASFSEALLRCVVMGLVAYGVYDLSNLATLRGWSWKVCVVDVVWGAFASGLAGSLAYLQVRRMRY